MKIREEAEKIVTNMNKTMELNLTIADQIESLVTRAVDEALDRAVYIVANTELYDYAMINKILALKSKQGEGNEGRGE